MAAKIEIYPSGNDEFRWRLRAANGQIVATGHESFVSKFNAKRAAGRAAILMRGCLKHQFAPVNAGLRPSRVREL